MKFALLIYQGTLFDALREEIAGELVDAVALADPIRALTVRVGSEVLVTGGPAGSVPLSGYLVVDCEDERRATEIAARLPGGVVEVRPLMDGSGLEM